MIYRRTDTVNAIQYTGDNVKEIIQFFKDEFGLTVVHSTEIWTPTKRVEVFQKTGEGDMEMYFPDDDEAIYLEKGDWACVEDVGNNVFKVYDEDFKRMYAKV